MRSIYFPVEANTNPAQPHNTEVTTVTLATKISMTMSTPFLSYSSFIRISYWNILFEYRIATLTLNLSSLIEAKCKTYF